MPAAAVRVKRSDGTRPWLRVLGKGAKVRELPLPTEVSDALRGWERRRPPELLEDPLLFPRLGHQRRDGSYPDAGGRLSGQGLSDVVKPIMLAAGVSEELAHPHVLRPTYGSLFMRRGGELSKLRELMGHASMDTTGVYVHHDRASLEAAIDADERGEGVLERHGEQPRRRRERAAISQRVCPERPMLVRSASVLAVVGCECAVTSLPSPLVGRTSSTVRHPADERPDELTS